MTASTTGRVWKFGDHVNTDLILPGFAMFKPLDEQPRYVFEAIRPGWAELVRPGDLVVAGHNFGVGSGRPIGQVLAMTGIVGIIADSFNGLGLRNCINGGVLALPCEEVSQLFEEGETARCHWDTGVVQNTSTGAAIQGRSLPAALIEIASSGGVIALLRRQGLVS